MMYLIILTLLFSFLLIMYRFLKGPTLSDRVVAFDILSIIAVSLLVVLALYFKNSIYLDIAIAIGLIGFLGATIFGRYIEKGI